MKIALIISIIPIVFLSPPSPDHCWRFKSGSPSIPDSCGSSSSLNFAVGTDGGPFCDSSGCNFDTNSKLHGTFPSGISTSWTILIWAIFSQSGTEELLTLIDNTSGLAQMRIVRNQLNMGFILAGSAYRTIQSNGWGSKQWVAMYVSSDGSSNQLYYGHLYQQSYTQNSLPFSLSLSTISVFQCGNGMTGSMPSNWLSRLLIYKQPYFLASTPYTINDIILDTHLSYWNPPISSERYLVYRLRSSYIQGESVLDSSTLASYNAVNGIDATTTANAVSINEGLQFDGSQQITLTSVSLSLRAFTIIVGFKWTTAPPSGWQILFQDPVQNINLRINPSGQIKLIFKGTSYLYLVGFPLQLSGGWNELALSFRPVNVASTFGLLYINGVSLTQAIMASNFPISQLVLGSSFTGIMQNFMLYTFPLGFESFVTPLNACHPLCSDCRDSSNTFCGACVSPAVLTSPSGFPSTCVTPVMQCHESCMSCNGPYYYNCLTCSPNFFQTFTDGNSGECTDNCSQYNPFFDGSSSKCQRSPQTISSSLSLRSQEEVFTLLLSFSQPLLFTKDFSITVPSLEHQIASALQIELTFNTSIDGHQIISLDFEPRTASSVSQNYEVPGTFSSQTLTTLSYLHTQHQIAKMLEVAPLFFGCISIACIISLAILQCFFQISAQIFWAMINFDQLVFFAPFMSLKLPALIFFIFQTLSFAVGDLYFVVYIYNLTIGRFFQNLNDQPYSQNFQAMGFSTYYLMNGAGPFLLILACQALFIPFYFLLSRDCKACKSKRETIIKCCGCTKWGMFIRQLLESSLQILLFSALNTVAFAEDILSTCSMLSQVIAIICLLCLLEFPFGLIRILARPPFQLGTRKSSTYRNYGETFKQLQYDKSFLSKHYFFWFFLRRFVLAMTLTFLCFSGKLQVAIAIILCLIEIVILFRVKPFKDRADNFINLLNQVCLLVIYALLGSLEYLYHFQQTIVIVIITTIIVLVNLLDFTILIVLKSKEARRKCKARKEQKIEREQLERRVVPKLKLEQTSQGSTISLFSPVNRFNELNSREPNRLDQSQFACGIRRFQRQFQPSTFSEMWSRDNISDYQETDTPSRVKIAFI